MPRNERTIWNEKYAEGTYSSGEPDAFLLDAYGRFLYESPPGDALDLAGGTGRNALWLAQRGWIVKLIDIADAAIALAERNAQQLVQRSSRSLRPESAGRIEAERIDLNCVRDLGELEYDLVLVFFYLRRELFPAITAALRPGGLLFYKTCTEEQLHLGGGPRNPDYLLRSDELRQGFQDLEILHYKETIASVATAELIARKPAVNRSASPNRK